MWNNPCDKWICLYNSFHITITSFADLLYARWPDHISVAHFISQDTIIFKKIPQARYLNNIKWFLHNEIWDANRMSLIHLIATTSCDFCGHLWQRKRSGGDIWLLPSWPRKEKSLLSSVWWPALVMWPQPNCKGDWESGGDSLMKTNPPCHSNHVSLSRTWTEKRKKNRAS